MKRKYLIILNQVRSSAMYFNQQKGPPGQNHLFLCENKFLRLFPSEQKKRKESAKITQKHA